MVHFVLSLLGNIISIIKRIAAGKLHTSVSSLPLAYHLLITIGEKFGCWVLFAFFMGTYHAAGRTLDAAKGTAAGIVQTAAEISGTDAPKASDLYAAAKLQMEGCKD